MNARRTTQTIAATIRHAIATTGTTPAIVAQATHIDLPELEERLSGTTPFSLTELVNVGGFLRLPAESLLEGVTA